MQPTESGTIFALASGAGRAAVAVMRLSGPATGPALSALCRRRPPPRHAGLRVLRDATGEALDRALVLWFPAPASYTGEDCGELHLHGSRAVVGGVADALTQLGLRPAEAGEFTRRAFLNGRMDLTEAEGVADLVAAETAEQRRQALAQMEGALAAVYGHWATRLRGLLAHQEALIDFPDEDLPMETEARLAADLDQLRDELAGHLADFRGERLREGLVFAVTGPPNAGKSSLVNALADREVAIVAPSPGTTRDAIEVRLDLGGVPVTLLDTAGLRETADPVEAEGVRRARAAAAAADFVIGVADATCPDAAAWVATQLRVANKTDLAAAPAEADVAVSARTGAGVGTLRERLGCEARRLAGSAGPAPLTRARHRAALREVAERLDGARRAAWPELRGEDLRLALRALGRVTGHVGTEDLLATIFGQFCIGK